MKYAKVTHDINVALPYIASGRVVAFPTGTSYGLAVDALQGHALQRLRNLKKRPSEKTFTICAKQELWPEYFAITPAEHKLLEEVKNQAVTILLVPKEPIAHLAQDGLVGLRMIDHPIMQAFMDALNVPVTATSANVSGENACQDIACIEKYFPGLLDDSDPLLHRAGATTYDLSLACVLDGGLLPQSEPSTILKVIDNKIEIVRQGAYNPSSLEID